MQRKASAVWKGGLKDGKGNDLFRQWDLVEHAVLFYDTF
jgi:hypothetical protein